MKRPYRGARARQALWDAAAVAPQFGLGADLIVGFPGETREEFEETVGLVRESALSYLHVFRFSRRPGTPAADMPGQVPPEAIAERSAVLRDLGAQKQEAFLRALVGSWREAVVETEVERPGWRQATADNYAAILVPQDLPTGALVKVRITEFRQGALFAAPEGA
jgi:threonylcarbamoyladenosine tRNA methylthiotransferase MtaB